MNNQKYSKEDLMAALKVLKGYSVQKAKEAAKKSKDYAKSSDKKAELKRNAYKVLGFANKAVQKGASKLNKKVNGLNSNDNCADKHCPSYNMMHKNSVSRESHDDTSNISDAIKKFLDNSNLKDMVKKASDSIPEDKKSQVKDLLSSIGAAVKDKSDDIKSDLGDILSNPALAGMMALDFEDHTVVYEQGADLFDHLNNGDISYDSAHKVADNCLIIKFNYDNNGTTSSIYIVRTHHKFFVSGNNDKETNDLLGQLFDAGEDYSFGTIQDVIVMTQRLANEKFYLVKATMHQNDNDDLDDEPDDGSNNNGKDYLSTDDSNWLNQF